MEQQEPQKRELRGLYKYVKIPVKVLDIVIVVCLAVIALFLVIELQDPGFTITFDTKGGTDVPAQKQMYGEYLNVPEPPTREGYVFTGWYKDDGCENKWFEEIDTVQSEMTLYAGWEKVE